MQEKRTYSRVALKEISPAPQSGLYLTSADIKAYVVLTGALFAFFSAALLFGRKA